MTTAPTIPIRPTLHVVDPDAEPSDAWIQGVARMLLAAADRRLAEQADHQDQTQALTETAAVV
jgi:hypothetical protein